MIKPATLGEASDVQKKAGWQPWLKDSGQLKGMEKEAARTSTLGPKETTEISSNIQYTPQGCQRMEEDKHPKQTSFQHITLVTGIPTMSAVCVSLQEPTWPCNIHQAKRR